MFLTLTAFLETWEKEAESTQRIVNALTDSSLSQTVTVQDRTLGRLAWHIVTSIPEMMEKTGLVFKGLGEEAPVPDTAQEIANYYKEVSTTIVTAIKDQWTDQTLLEERDMYGELWTIGTTLNVLINHQIHHRGQMTVLMRQADLKVPGIYGPAREDWGQFGMEAPLV